MCRLNFRGRRHFRSGGNVPFPPRFHYDLVVIFIVVDRQLTDRFAHIRKDVSAAFLGLLGSILYRDDSPILSKPLNRMMDLFEDEVSRWSDLSLNSRTAICSDAVRNRRFLSILLFRCRIAYDNCTDPRAAQSFVPSTRRPTLSGH